MKNFILILAVLLASLVLSHSQAQTVVPPKTLIGEWAGILELPGGKNIRLVFNISLQKDSLNVTIKSPDQSSAVFPGNILLNNNKLHISINSLGLVYDGIFNPSDTSVSGTFTQGSYSSDMELKPFHLNRPQEPRPPFPYISEDVVFKNEPAGIELSGTLTMPEGKGPFPAVILISGSGPQDRNEEIYGHKLFWVIADYFTRNGIAVLRYDDRGTGKSTGNYRASGMMDFASDAEAAVRFLRSNDKINKSQIGLVGHSEGGCIAPILASRDKGIAFIIMMAGLGIPGDQLLLLQAEKFQKLAKVPEDVCEMEKKIKIKIFRDIKKGLDSAKVASNIVKYYSALKPADQEKVHFSTENADMVVKSFLNPEIRSLIMYNPADYLKKVTCPVLAINGERDLQVPPKENLKGIEVLLKEGGNKNYTIKELWLLNHLFQTAETGSISEYEEIDETIAEAALETMNSWIQQIVSKGK